MNVDLIIDVSNKLTGDWTLIKVVGGSDNNFYEAVPELFNESAPACMRDVLEYLQMKPGIYSRFVLESIASGLSDELIKAGFRFNL
tara:strand:- start:387 stop:644 length:258 start_codon:yes stop_codon:yes gene_type:complete